MPLNTLLTPEQYAYMLEDSRAEAVLISAPLMQALEPILDRLTHLRSAIVAGADAGSAVPKLGRLETHRFADILARGTPESWTAPTMSDEVAFWLYSSGSTGAPKGAKHVHTSLMATARLYGQGILGFCADDVVFSVAKLYFAYGLGNAMTFPFAAGACSVLLADRPTPQSVVALLKQEKPTFFFGVPTLFAGILADATATDLGGRLRWCVSAGEPLPRDIGLRWRERYGVDILDGIGSTELLHIFVSLRPGDVRYGTTGKPVPGYEAQIVDEQDRPVAAGEIGELRISGPSSAIAYWNNREKSLQAFRGRWTYTGDKYRQDADGYYVYCGRSDDMIKAGGQWVSPAEVESALVAHPSVLEAAVVAHKDENQLDKPKAFVVLKPGTRATSEELQRFVKERLAPFKYPRWVEFVDGLPKTATGKIQRFKLRDRPST